MYEFQASFGDIDSVRTTLNKIKFETVTWLMQHIFTFLHMTFPSGEEALVDQFHYGLHNDLMNIFSHIPRSSEIIDGGYNSSNTM